MLARRRSGEKYDADAFDAFMLSLVSMPDESIQEMFQTFDSLGSGTQYLSPDARLALLRRLDVPEPEEGILDAASAAFCQLVCEKLGESIGMPQQLRVQLHEQGVRERKRRELQQEAHRAKERARAEAKARQEALAAAERAEEKALNGSISSVYAFVWPLLDGGENAGVEPKEVRRFRNHPELRLLLLADKVAMERVPSHEWRRMACSGLRQPEMRCLLFLFEELGIPKMAEGFHAALQEKVVKPKSEADKAELRKLPAWALPFCPNPPEQQQEEENPPPPAPPRAAQCVGGSSGSAACFRPGGRRRPLGRDACAATLAPPLARRRPSWRPLPTSSAAPAPPPPPPPPGSAPPPPPAPPTGPPPQRLAAEAVAARIEPARSHRGAQGEGGGADGKDGARRSGVRAHARSRRHARPWCARAGEAKARRTSVAPGGAPAIRGRRGGFDWAAAAYQGLGARQVLAACHAALLHRRRRRLRRRLRSLPSLRQQRRRLCPKSATAEGHHN